MRKALINKFNIQFVMFNKQYVEIKVYSTSVRCKIFFYKDWLFSFYCVYYMILILR